jgi:hypothetical protein
MLSEEDQNQIRRIIRDEVSRLAPNVSLDVIEDLSSFGGERPLLLRVLGNFKDYAICLIKWSYQAVKVAAIPLTILTTIRFYVDTIAPGRIPDRDEVAQKIHDLLNDVQFPQGASSPQYNPNYPAKYVAYNDAWHDWPNGQIQDAAKRSSNPFFDNTTLVSSVAVSGSVTQYGVGLPSPSGEPLPGRPQESPFPFHLPVPKPFPQSPPSGNQGGPTGPTGPFSV